MDPKVKQKITEFYTVNKTAIDDLASYLGVPPLWVVSVFHLESGLFPGARNTASGAVGLNQMMPSTLADYGITADQYRAYSVAQQVELMKKFFKPAKGLIKRAGDLYLYNFYPAAVIKNYPMDFAIGEDENFTSRYGVSLNKIYDQNAGLDFNKDSKLTRGDIEALFEQRYDELVTLKDSEFFFTGLDGGSENQLDSVAVPGYSPADRHFPDPENA